MGTFAITKCLVNLPSYCEARLLSTCLTLKPGHEKSSVVSNFARKQRLCLQGTVPRIRYLMYRMSTSTRLPQSGVIKYELSLFLWKLCDLCMSAHAFSCTFSDYFQNYFNKVSGNHGYSTRAATNDDLTIPFFLTNCCQKSFKYQGSKL